MVVDVSVTGADDFLALSRRMKEAGESGLRKELHKAMTAAAKPLIPKVRAAAAANLPQRGGLARSVSRKPVRAQTRTGNQTAGVRIVAAKVDPRLDEGRLAHPVFGRPNSTVVQQVPGAVGYFSKTLENEGPQVRDTLIEVLEDFTNRLAGPL